MNLKLLLLFCALLKRKIFSQDASCSYDDPWISTTKSTCSATMGFHPQTLPQCPHLFEEASNFCYIVSKKSLFPPKCPFENLLPFDSYKNIVVDPIWVPVRRNLTNGFGFLQWTEASNRYKTVFDDLFFYNGTIKAKDCLLYQNKSYVAVSCQEEHSGVCAYQKLNQWNNPLCGDNKTCRQSTLNSKSKCICLKYSQNGTMYPKAEFLEPYQNHVIELLTNKTCAIGLQKTPNGTFVWYNSHKEVSYGFWSPEAVFDDGYLYGASTPSGWVLTEQPIPDCRLIEKEPNEVFPTLSLSRTYDSVAKLVLNVSHPIGLKLLDSAFQVYCFTDADLSLLYRYSNLTVVTSTDTYIVYQFEPLQYGPGHYWCETFKHTNLKPLHSNVIFFKENDFGDEADLTLSVGYDEGTNPLSPDIINSVKNSLSNYSCPFRIMKITEVDEDNKLVVVNVRFCCPKRKFVINPFVEEPIEPCLAISENNLHWPETLPGAKAYPEEYCFVSDCVRPTRICNFVDGPQWAEITEFCRIPAKSSITPLLLDFKDDVIDDTSIISILEISKKYYKLFNAFDVYVSSELIRVFVEKNYQNELEAFDVVDNILKVDANVLIGAQSTMCAAENWLDLFEKMRLKASSSVVSRINFAFASTIGCTDCAGIMALKEGNTSFQSVKPIANSQTLEDIIVVEKFDCAIWLRPSVERKGYKAISTIYFKSDFFRDFTLSTQPSKVFEYQLSPSSVNQVVLIHRFGNDTPKNFRCAYWSKERRRWVPDEELQILDSNLICTFWQTGHFAFIRVEKTPTVTLTEILESDATASEILLNLYDVSFYYRDFVPFDVYLVGQILKKISTDTHNKTSFEMLGGIVNNLHKIKRAVLFESQIKNNKATDTILHYTDYIIQHCQCQVCALKSISKNFVSLMFNLTTTDFIGVILFNNHSLEILNGSINTTELLEYEDINSALVLSPELKTQMGPNGLVAVNIFFIDVLFNENQKNSKQKKVSTIYDVLLPENISNLAGPIQIFYKINTNFNSQCSHWFYNIKVRGIDGFWKIDNKTENFSFFALCDFYHTTHFALLIMDKPTSVEHDYILEWITNVNLSLSFVGFFGVALTAILFRSWRAKTGNKILLNFVFSGLFQIGVFYSSSPLYNLFENVDFCIVTGVVLHYSVLAQSCWMLIIAILQYQRYVVVLGTYSSNILIKSCFFAWGVPFIPVIWVVCAGYEYYEFGDIGFCYPSGNGLYIGLWFPICVVLLINLLIFIRVIISVLRNKTECDNFSSKEAIYQWRLFIFLFFILGLTWIFGFLAEMEEGIVFVYLFCTLATLQGFVTFLFFIVLNENVRDFYMRTRAFKFLCRKST